MTELELMFDLHKDADRQGPGSPEVTKLALEIAGLSHGEVKKIADIGCGTGGQTLTLARETEAGITAIDFSQTFLEKLTAESRAEGFSDRITPLKVSMDALPFAEEELDLIWSFYCRKKVRFHFSHPSGDQALIPIRSSIPRLKSVVRTSRSSTSAAEIRNPIAPG